MSEKQIDQELVNQVLKGDKEAYDVLVIKYQEPIRRLVVQMIGDPAVAMDIAQDAFIAAYRALDKFKGESSFYTWLYRIAINTTKNHLKKKGRRPPDDDIELNDALNTGRLQVTDFATPDHLLQCDQLQEAVVNAVNGLPEELRTSIVLREIAGLSYDEIAVIMECPVGTVRSRIFRARNAVDQLLKPYI